MNGDNGGIKKWLIVGSISVTGVTTASATTDVVNRDYIDHRSPLPIQTGNSGSYLSTNGIGISYSTISNSQEFTTTGAQTFTVPANATIFYIECVGSGSGGAGGAAAAAGAGGGSGSYTSWYVQKSFVSSNMTVTVGVGGNGGAAGGGVANIGQPTTVSWTGPGSLTYTLTSFGGGSAGAAATSQIGGRSSWFYTVAGLTGLLQGLVLLEVLELHKLDNINQLQVEEVEHLVLMVGQEELYLILEILFLHPVEHQDQ